MYQEQEKRLYYISNDEVDYERIELIDRQLGKTLHAMFYLIVDQLILFFHNRLHHY